jgi:hypothetical protein
LEQPREEQKTSIALEELRGEAKPGGGRHRTSLSWQTMTLFLETSFCFLSQGVLVQQELFGVFGEDVFLIKINQNKN